MKKKILIYCFALVMLLPIVANASLLSLDPEFTFGLKHFPDIVQKENTTIHGSMGSDFLDEAYWIYPLENIISTSWAEVTYLAHIPPGSWHSGFLPVYMEAFWLDSVEHVRKWIQQGNEVDGEIFGDSQLIAMHSVNIWTNEFYPPEWNTFSVLPDITAAIDKRYFGIRIRLMHPESVGDHVSLRFDVWGDELIPIKMDAEIVPAPATIFLLGSGLICLASARRKFKK